MPFLLRLLRRQKTTKTTTGLDLAISTGVNDSQAKTQMTDPGRLQIKGQPCLNADAPEVSITDSHTYNAV